MILVLSAAQVETGFKLSHLWYFPETPQGIHNFDHHSSVSIKTSAVIRQACGTNSGAASAPGWLQTAYSRPFQTDTSGKRSDATLVLVQTGKRPIQKGTSFLEDIPWWSTYGVLLWHLDTWRRDLWVLPPMVQMVTSRSEANWRSSLW